MWPKSVPLVVVLARCKYGSASNRTVSVQARPAGVLGAGCTRRTRPTFRRLRPRTLKPLPQNALLLINYDQQWTC